MKRILHQLSKAICAFIVGPEAQSGPTPHVLDDESVPPPYVIPQSGFIPHVLRDLVDLETRPLCLTKIAYDWCSVIYENRHTLEDWEGLLLTSLEVGFRHLDPQVTTLTLTLTHTEHHREVADIVFKSQNVDAIADLLQSWAVGDSPPIPPGARAERLVCLCNLVPFSSRLRQLVICSVEFVCYGWFEGVGVDRLVELLGHLHVTVEDMVLPFLWIRILVGTLKTSEGARLLSHWYWELLVELVVSELVRITPEVSYNPQITAFLTEAQEWSKLECWMGTVWISWPPEDREITEEDLSYSMLLLCRQRPGALQKLEQWMERRSQVANRNIPESFQRICKQAREAAQQDTP